MGLFSTKKESHTVAEAIQNCDEKFSYISRTGFTYNDFPYLKQVLYQTIAATSFDDAFEMYAPHFMETINRIDKNMELLAQQNQLLQLKCDALAQELELIKKDNVRIR